MNPVEVGLLAQGVLLCLAVLGALAGLRLVAALATAGIGIAAIVTGSLVLAGQQGGWFLNTALPIAPLTVSPTPLGALFMIIVGAVGAVAAVYAIGYAHGPADSRTAWTMLAVFIAGMLLVTEAADVVTFCLAWELMALSSTALVLTEYATRRDVRSAAAWYAAMTHLSFLLVLVGFAILVTIDGTTSFAQMAQTPTDSVAASIAFTLLAIGFATKAGAVPMHVWLPRAHPAAPSHVSAVMSAAMVKMGIYGILLVTLQILPGGPSWWALLVIALGAVSAVYGILEASVEADLKRLLAYSTTENIGLMLLATGAAMLLKSTGEDGPANVAIAAAMLLAISHAAFKTTLFLGAGSILHATGVRDLDELGGLGVRMPVTAVTFGLGALGAAALPISIGFVAEWTLLQALIHGSHSDDRLVDILMPISVGAVALTAGLALLTFVKAFGIAFLARPRSTGAEHAHDASATMKFSLLVSAILVVVLGLVPGTLIDLITRATGITGVTSIGFLGIDLASTGALLDPIALVALTALVAIPALLVVWFLARKYPRRAVDVGWGCGGVRTSPRMQYTATSYAEPLVRIFRTTIRPRQDVELMPARESQYLVSHIEYHQAVVDGIEDRAWRPVVRTLDWLGIKARGLQNGSITRYLAYALAALVIVMLVVAL